MIEILIHLQSPGNSQHFLERLLQRILEPAISNFDLEGYATYVGSRFSHDGYSNTWKGYGKLEKGQSTRAGPIKAFYERAYAHDWGTASRFLEKLRLQAPELTTKQLHDFLMPLLEDLITVVDVSSSEVQELFQSLLTLYITKKVGKELKKPSDWARPQEVVSKPFLECDCHAKMNEFLLDPNAQTHKISCEHASMLKQHYHWFRYFKVESVNYTPVSVTKSLKWWENQHEDWERRSSTALTALRKFPQDELKKCLAHRYDEIMDLRMMKVDDDSTGGAESTSEVQHSNQTQSTVPQKRPHSDL